MDQGFVETPLQRTYRKLIDVATSHVHGGRSDIGGPLGRFGNRTGRSRAEGGRKPHLVLVAYSRATVDLAAALRTWIADRHRASVSPNKTSEDVPALLRQAVTVVTIAAVTRSFPDGPAYIHVGAWEDKVVQGRGVSALRPEGGGQGAVYLNFHTPYRTDANDAHIFGAATCQFLSIVMHWNGVGSFQELYELGLRKEIQYPDGMEEEVLPAMIVATRGAEWLWDPRSFVRRGGRKHLPSKETARRILDGAFGEGFYETVASANGGGAEGIVEQFTSGLFDDKEWQTSNNLALKWPTLLRSVVRVNFTFVRSNALLLV